ncbi:hypothetical protein B1729_10295 [Microbacterium sp. B35-04]|uniref:CU044_2847 family protein n=1 Tax=unclassified Microbacterium TaxID=2609290 RepID=UPI0013D7888E|nr:MULTISPECIES: CU044_2847 family protein [unclassified Microbacterium]KAF2413332.1 hypothetical protein B1729_10295 [Microbacterium sp. B35-04]KAF2418195.1 hypothetical protein B2K11_09300 [Microbacterium sp. B35-30]
MAEVVGFAMVGGEGEVYVEVKDDDVGVARASRGGELLHSAVDVGAALGKVEEFTTGVLERFRSLPRPPDSVDLEFGIKLSAAAGVVIAQTGAEGHLTVKLSWTKPAKGQDDADT